MDKRVAMTAMLAVAFILASSILVMFYNPQVEDRELTILARVNTEGSGLYIDPDKGTADEYMEVLGDGTVVFKAEGWGGKVFGTPGPTTIQHMQLKEIVEGMGLKFTLYSEGLNSKDSVYYIPSITNAAAYASTPVLSGAIIWEPQYQAALDSGARKAVKMFTTDEVFPGHACCVISASHDYVTSHSDVTVRFLAAYVKAVDWMNAAAQDKGSDDYAKLIEIAVDKTGHIFSNEVVETAMDHVNYTYGLVDGRDSAKSPLVSLQDDVESLVDGYYSSANTLKKSMSDLGFSSTHVFAQRVVNDGYLSSALEFVPSASGYQKTSITVAAIAGDIHQIALHVANELGYFSDYGLTVNVSTAANGAGVATSMENGEANFGFLGAPPLLQTIINGGLSTS